MVQFLRLGPVIMILHSEDCKICFENVNIDSEAKRKQNVLVDAFFVELKIIEVKINKWYERKA